MTKNDLKKQIREWVQEVINEPKIDPNKVVRVEVDGVDRRDYPDFVDSYVISAYYKDPVLGGKERPLTDDEIEWLNNEYPEIAQEKAMEKVLGI